MKVKELFGPSSAMQELMKQLHDATSRYKALKTPEAQRSLQKIERRILNALNRDPYKK
jgi:hypothetical protein